MHTVPCERCSAFCFTGVACTGVAVTGTVDRGAADTGAANIGSAWLSWLSQSLNGKKQTN